jgi:hypothetical protein
MHPWVMSLPHVVFPVPMSCVIIVRVVAAVEEGEDECNLEPVMSFARAHAAYRAVKSFFYTHSIARYDKQNILNLELPLFCLKHMLSNETIINFRFFVWKMLFACRFYVCAYFCRPKCKIKIFIFCFPTFIVLCGPFRNSGSGFTMCMCVFTCETDPSVKCKNFCV